MGKKFVVILIILFSIILFVNVSASSQIDWLKNQQDLYLTGLLDSYENDFGESCERCAYTYDQALAIIAFTKAGELQRARKILDKMENLQDSSGRWYECYDASNGNLGNSACNLYNTGPISWMVIAINFYEAETKDKQYSSIAEKALSWLDTMRNTNSGDEKYGSLRYCTGTACLIPDAISTEHNVDAYSAYFWRYRLTGNEDYKNKANLIKSYLAREMWAPSNESNEPYHNVNIFWRGFNDSAWCTDTQSWSVLSLGKTGADGEEFYKSLDWLYYNPYGSTRNQQDFNLTILDVDGFKSCTEDVNYIWLEGTEGVAAAFYSINDFVNGSYFHDQTRRVISGNGGIIHTFTETNSEIIRWPENWRYHGVADASWYYFNEFKINPFSPDFTIIGDVDGNCKVDIFDLAAVGIAYGSVPGNPNWNANADLNLNGEVDIFDLATVGLHYGRGC